MRCFISASFTLVLLALSVAPAGGSPLIPEMPVTAVGQLAQQQAPPPPSEPSIVLLVDQSGSLSDADILREQAAVELLAVSDSATNAGVAVVGFGSSNGSGQNAVDALCPTEPLTDPPARQRVIDCARRLHKRTVAEGNDTDHVAAMKAGLEQLSDSTGPGIIFLLTDGKLDVGNSPQYGPEPASRNGEAKRQLTDEVLPAVKKAGIQVWPIGFGQIDAPALETLAAGGAGPNPFCKTSSRPRPVTGADSTTVANQFLEVLGSARCNRTTTSKPGKVEDGGTTDLEIDIPEIATGGTISVLRANPRINVAYIDPKGREVPLDGTLDGSTFAHTTGETIDGLRITEPEAGRWKARLTAPEGVAAPLVQASISWKGALRTAIDVRPLVPAPGDEVAVRVRLQTRRGVTVDPGQVADLSFGLTVSGEGFESIGSALTIDPKEPTVAAGRFTLPREASGVVDVIGEVDGLGVENDRRPYSFTISKAGEQLDLALTGGRQIALRRGSSTELSLETRASGRSRSLRVETKRFDDGTMASVTPTVLSVPLGVGTQKLTLTVEEGSVSGPQSVEVVFFDEEGTEQQLGASVVFFTVQRDPSALSKVLPFIVGIIVAAALGALAWVVGRRALAPPPVGGLVAHLVDPEGRTTDDMGNPHGRCEAPLGQQQQFAFSVETTEYTVALITASPTQPEAITVTRTRTGGLRVAQPDQPMSTVALGSVIPLAGISYGLVVVSSNDQPGPYPGWQQQQQVEADVVPPDPGRPDPDAPHDSTIYTAPVAQSDDLL